jgi:hypothetical protein
MGRQAGDAFESNPNRSHSTMKSQLILLPAVVAVICFSPSCTKTYYVDRTMHVEPKPESKPGTQLNPDRKQLGERGHSPYPGQQSFESSPKTTCTSSGSAAIRLIPSGI